ncbi:MAG TPA: biotin/lipoyl-binding protein [Bacteroidales bacterium]|nr:biotin/lipoyl-binding protein [Bacteroidales bacterium]MDD4234717.1 biotin/lipoyl-binding protein [Bacteroidales bacterium]HRW22212.1 biotin/lipoyl-binding protein [Bacteroidales bacterium]HXK81370.1 biotin/lipoyl-binding protein [Bacteroidales bacterium]
MKKFKFKINGTLFDVHVKNVEGKIAELEVNGSTYNVELEQEVKKVKTPTIVKREIPAPEKKETKMKSDGAVSKVFAPLPGVILSVKVKEGDKIEKGALLLVLEAMKMENNIFSDTAGTVQSIKVKDGDTVLQNDTLVEITL